MTHEPLSRPTDTSGSRRSAEYAHDLRLVATGADVSPSDCVARLALWLVEVSTEAGAPPEAGREVKTCRSQRVDPSAGTVSRSAVAL